MHTTTEVRTAPPATRRLGREAGFWLVGLAVLLFLSASSAPSPLYVVYQQQWGFSAATLTAVFAVYAVALLLALLTVGGVSDFVGRRPVLLAALALEAVSMVAFLAADGVAGLVLARALQGVATGAATGVASAALVDLAPARSPGLGALVNSSASTGGLALGAVGSGLLVQLAPAPTTLVFVVLLVAMLVLAATVWFLPESVTPRPGALASLRPRFAVPRQARRAFVAALPVLVATWSMGALYLSLGPSLAVGVLGLTSHLVGALVVAVFTGSGAVAAVLARNVAPPRMTTVGAGVLAVGTSLTVTGLDLPSVPLFLVGTALAGTGFGTGFLGAFRTLASLAGPGERAELLASVYLVNYLAFSVPAVVAGLLVPVLGLQRTASAYGVVVVVLALVVVTAGATRRPAPAARAAGCGSRRDPAAPAAAARGR